MHNITSKEIKCYIKSIRRLMPVYSKTEKQYLSFLQEKVYDYIIENPFCTIENIIRQFGEPKEVMEQYFLALDDEYIQGKLHIKHKVTLISIICILIISIVCLLFVFKNYQDYSVSRDAYIGQEEIIIEEF